MITVLDFLRNGTHYKVSFTEDDYKRLHKNDTFSIWEKVHDSSGLSGLGSYLCEENIKLMCEAFNVTNYKIETV